jgi:hypothetical protein
MFLPSQPFYACFNFIYSAFLPAFDDLHTKCRFCLHRFNAAVSKSGGSANAKEFGEIRISDSAWES